VRWGAPALALAILAGPPALAAPRLPTSPAERALDQVLRTADKDDNLLDNLFHGRAGAKSRQTVDYTKFLTPKLIDTIYAEQQRTIRADCGAKPDPGDQCGLDYSPITCGQDTPKHYLYETARIDASTAIISSFWPKPQGRDAVYRLVKTGAGWRIDGLRCLDAGKLMVQFNMPKPASPETP
jgi:hypothetical protein